MNIAQNLPSSVPFFTALEKQTFRHSYCTGYKEFVAIECRYDRLLPWIIKKTPEASATYVYIVAENGLSAMEITSLLTMHTETVDSVGYTYWNGGADIAQSTDGNLYSRASSSASWSLAGDVPWSSFVCDGGYYYLEVKIGTTTYFSELLHIVDFPEFGSETVSDGDDTRVRIAAISSCPVAGVPTDTLPEGMEQKLFVNSRVARPEYIIDRTVGKDGNEVETPIWTRLNKRFYVRFYACETVCDFVATLPLYGTVYVSDQYGIQTTVSDIEIKVTWGEEGNDCAALVEMSFVRDYVSHTDCC